MRGFYLHALPYPFSPTLSHLLGQVKRSICITRSDKQFAEAIEAAWSDFNNPSLFKKETDTIALITGSLSTTDHHNVQWLLDQAKHTKDEDEFFRNIDLANFSPAKSGEKLKIIRYHLIIANNDIEVSSNELYSFLRHYHSASLTLLLT